MTESLIELEAVECRRGNTMVLRDISFSVAQGEIVALVGPNGSGKSTLIRSLSGLARPATGAIRFAGEDLYQLSGRHRARSIAVVGQTESPDGDQLVGEVVALGLLPHRPPWARPNASEREAVRTALARVGLDNAVDQPIDRLSGGEQRRVLIARALAQQSPVLILDEPTNHLDVHHQHDLLSTVRALGRTVIAAIHDLDLAASYFDRVAVLHDHQLQALGPPESTLTPATIAEVFGVRASPVVDPTTGRQHLLITGTWSR